MVLVLSLLLLLLLLRLFVCSCLHFRPNNRTITITTQTTTRGQRLCQERIAGLIRRLVLSLGLSHGFGLSHGLGLGHLYQAKSLFGVDTWPDQGLYKQW